MQSLVFFKEIDTWIEVKPQVVVGSVTITLTPSEVKLKMFGLSFMVPIKLGCGQGNGVRVQLY